MFRFRPTPYYFGTLCSGGWHLLGVFGSTNYAPFYVPMSSTIAGIMTLGLNAALATQYRADKVLYYAL